MASKKGLKIPRLFTRKGKDPLDDVKYELRTSRITNPDGSTVFEMKEVEVPAEWSQVATDVLAQKYFRKKGVPDENGGRNGSEWSAKMVTQRLAGTWRYWGEKYGYFASGDDAQTFEDELKHMLIRQMGSPNSPQWFNTGLAHAYGIKGEAQGHYFVDPDSGELKKGEDAYTRGQVHACFIQSVKDDLVNEGGIFDLVLREARLFKFGSGTGSNFSHIRGKDEHLSGGGRSSGLMSFLSVIDRAAGAIKSGGTTRRAAKMVCLDIDHPEVEDFINWKVIEEQKVASLVTGSHLCHEYLQKILLSAHEAGLNPEKNPTLKKLIFEANKHFVPLNYIKRILMLAEQGLKPEEFDFRRYETDFRSEAYLTVSGQNSNNSLRVTNDFMDAVESGRDFELKNRIDGKTCKKIPAEKLWNEISHAAWACADPGIQYHTTINEWHTCPENGQIQASNPCVTGDTLVSTADGYRKIEELVGKEADTLDICGNVRHVKHVFRTGYKPVYELKTKNGYRVKVTKDHLVYTLNRRWVPAEKLNTTDVLMLGTTGFGREHLDETFAEALGLSVGDGCLTGKQENLFITLGKEERGVAEKINSYFNAFKANHAEDRREARQTAVCETKTTSRVNTASRTIVDRLKTYAVLDCGSEQKKFTDAIYALNKTSLAATLRGLFTADGTVANYGEKSHYVSLDSCSLKLLKQVQLLLLAFDIKSKLYENRRAGIKETLLPDGKGGHKMYPVKEMHSLRISRSSRSRFAAEIGFIAGTKKTEKLLTINETVATYRDRPLDQFESLTYIGEENVYDLTEPITHSFVANGLLVHNCSEYMFLDDTACNLMSLNLIKFYDAETKKFNIEAYKHAVRIWTIVLEISVLMAQFPSKEIAQKSYDFRTLGLGYANLGTLLMQTGIAYDSEEGFAICGALTAIACGESYATSAEMASMLGPFAKYEQNKKHMLRVIRNHRRAAYNEKPETYEALSVTPQGIDEKHCPKDLLEASRESWDRALELGEKFGFRNAQVTVLAPTGTIGLQMDCDTTGIEPDFALVKFKKLVGGGYFKIVNQSLETALQTLGYDSHQIQEIEAYVKGRGTLQSCPFINAESLQEKGFTEKEIFAIEAQLPNVFELKFAFNKWILGEDFCKNSLGMNEHDLANQNFDILKAIGFSDEQIEEANEYVCGVMTVEGAPHLKKEHYAIFDCANRCGKKGRRFIPWKAHLRMMSSAQPFISGAISKTINMPEDATIEDVKQAYKIGHSLMLKAVALYRDGSKLSQPLSTAVMDKTFAELFSFEDLEQTDEQITPKEITQAIAAEVRRPYRRKLPEERRSITHKFSVGSHEGYLTVGLYEDGTPGEMFVKMSKEGSTLSGIMDALALTLSLCLQYGVPLEVIVSKFAHARFEPSGMTGNRYIPMVKSIIDYIGRWLALKFLTKETAKKYHNEELVNRAYAEGDITVLPKVPVEGTHEEHRAIKPLHKEMKEEKMVLVAQPQDLAKTQQNLALSMGNEDAPFCSACGTVMIRNGSCYKCMDCGETSGCS